MSFRLVVRLPGERGGPGYSDCTLASDALSIYRRLSKTRRRIEKILDLRSDGERQITGHELEAIAQCERQGKEGAS
jgi:hypothetical protein